MQMRLSASTTDHSDIHHFFRTPNLESYALVMINIVPQNTNAPVIINSGGSNVFSYPENLYVGSLLSTVTLQSTDADSPKTWLVFDIKSSNEVENEALREVERTEGAYRT